MAIGGLGRDDLEAAFASLGAAARAAGLTVEIAIYGGAALVLTFPSRVATKDVDAVVSGDARWLRRAAADFAAERGWPEDWLNDRSKALLKSYPSETEPGLRVYVATPHYLFAMKCLAMRIAGVDDTRDRSDILMLGQEIGVTSAEEALGIVAEYLGVMLGVSMGRPAYFTVPQPARTRSQVRR